MFDVKPIPVIALFSILNCMSSVVVDSEELVSEVNPFGPETKDLGSGEGENLGVDGEDFLSAGNAVDKHENNGDLLVYIVVSLLITYNVLVGVGLDDTAEETIQTTNFQNHVAPTPYKGFNT